MSVSQLGVATSRLLDPLTGLLSKGAVRTGMGLLLILAAATRTSAQSPQLYATAMAPNVDTFEVMESATDPVDAQSTLPPTTVSAFGGFEYTVAADAKARADFGSLGASASVVNGNLAFAGASWRDQFTITGAPNGTLLEFDVAFSVTGDLTRLENSFRQTAQVKSWITGFPDGGTCPVEAVVTCNWGVQETFEHEGRTLTGSYARTIRVQLVAGQVYDVTQSLTTYTFHGGVYYYPEALTAGAFATADFLNDGASFSLTPVSPGAGYTTASGHRYDAATANTAPTADAGDNQTARPGVTVHLDGSGSFDDNTNTQNLQYAWTFVSVPNESTLTTLTGANTISPSFEPDVLGDFVVQLIVTDQGGLSSQPSQVTIGENPPPTASAGPDQLVIVGSVVALTGSGADPDDESLTYAWALTEAPTGSTAQLYSPTLADTTFIPDRPGVYRARLTVSDPVGPGEPDSVQITAMTAAGYAEVQIQAASTQILGLPSGAVTNRGNQNALTQFLSNAVVALQSGDMTAARHQLEQAISRTDGCELRGTPDGNGPGRDWITTCGAQDQVYPSLVDALAVIAP